MKLTRTVATILLLLFVGVTVGTLIAQEVARTGPQPMAEIEPILPAEPEADTASDAAIDDGQQVEPVETSQLEDVPLADEDSSTEPVAESSSAVGAVETAPCVVDAVYFHNTHRCVTCLKIEGDARAIVEETFAEELAAGTLRWSTINMEDNPALIVQYDLASPSLVLMRKNGDQVIEWVLLEETWALVRSTTRFSAYIIDSFSTFLEGCL